MYNGQAQDVFDDDVAKLKGSAEMNGSIADLQNMKDDGPSDDESSDGSSSNDEGGDGAEEEEGVLDPDSDSTPHGKKKSTSSTVYSTPKSKAKGKAKASSKKMAASPAGSSSTLRQLPFTDYGEFVNLAFDEEEANSIIYPSFELFQRFERGELQGHQARWVQSFKTIDGNLQVDGVDGGEGIGRGWGLWV